ncbi:MAG TPA: DUF4331 domain-containing protein [Steroidobacteraceae bacterium]|jgi:hypothetical protein|nr:DUF4331 domain-containing protein [Steroidobacteraceae bacterium]
MKHALKLFVPLLATFALAWDIPAEGASHREAPLIALDPTADNTDVYAFVSYDAANLARAPADRRVTFILNVIPGQDPSDGPNYFNFDDEVRYAINIDNDRDGKADDIVYEFHFKTENRPVVAVGDLTSPLPYLGNPHIPIGVLQGITALDGPGSEGLTRRQTYSVTEIRRGKRTELFSGRTLIAVPSNVGPATMPDYPALAAQGTYSDDATGIRVFAGQRAETFYIDLGAVFDTLNLRRYLPALTGPGEDSDNVNPFGVNRFSGFNISTIAIEVPITRITNDRKPVATTNNPVIGVFANTARQKVRVLGQPGEPADEDGPFVQVSRMANPLVNELIITTPFKDGWNATKPENEANFQAFYQNPVVATELNLVFNVPIVPINGSPANSRTDLMSLLLKYPGQALNGTNCGQPCAELLRLDLSVPPTAPENQSRLGAALSTDPAGYPNGRRPNDDVTDITVRVVGGTNYINAHIGDGVNFLAGAPGVVGVDITANGIAKEFPFLPTPYDGRCGAGQGSNPCVPPVP